MELMTSIETAKLMKKEISNSWVYDILKAEIENIFIARYLLLISILDCTFAAASWVGRWTTRPPFCCLKSCAILCRPVLPFGNATASFLISRGLNNGLQSPKWAWTARRRSGSQLSSLYRAFQGAIFLNCSISDRASAYWSALRDLIKPNILDSHYKKRNNCAWTGSWARPGFKEMLPNIFSPWATLFASVTQCCLDFQP